MLTLLLAVATTCPRPAAQADCSISKQACAWDGDDEAKIEEWHAMCRKYGPNKCAVGVTKSQINPTLYGVVCGEVGK